MTADPTDRSERVRMTTDERDKLNDLIIGWHDQMISDIRQARDAIQQSKFATADKLLYGCLLLWKVARELKTELAHSDEDSE